jgi:hypothetical protein
MPKGFFTQGIAVLFQKAVPLVEIESLLGGFTVLKRIETPGEFAGPTLIVDFKREVNGLAAIDVVNGKWPDQMGDPEKDPKLFAAWSMGHFGPFAFPGSLERALQHLWGWPAGRELPARHEAFVRVKLSYVFGGDGQAPVFPPNYAPRAELEFLNSVTLALLDHPAALALFNPNGEVLADKSRLSESIEYHRGLNLPPLNMWSNVRDFSLPNGWSLMDSVGMNQLEARDSELCFPKGAYDKSTCDAFIRNVGLYLLENGDVIADGNTMDGPGDIRWHAYRLEEPFVGPPRRVLRWFPQAEIEIPAELRPAALVKKGLLGRLRGIFGK